MALPAAGYKLTGISSKAYEHPADRAATAALGSIPYLDVAVRKLIEIGYERALRSTLLGASVRLGDDQLPDVWRAHRRAYVTLDIEPVPDLYISAFPIANAMTIGAGKPIVVVQSEMVRLLDAERLRAVFAHEAGHVLSDHVLYRTALTILLALGASMRLPIGLLPVRAALLEWSRAAELSCDRAAALVVRDPLVVCRVLMSLAAGAEAERLDLDAFMRQALDHREKGSGLDRLSRLTMDLGLTHPLPVKRVGELMAWVREGHYDRIVDGDYARRGEPLRPREEAAEAAAHYADRFSEFFKDAGQTVKQSLAELTDWLKKSAPPG
ncbi:MAG: M48 family metallopeptidase [Solirubrobacteraceae bacterium]